MPQPLIYLDYAAATPVDEGVLALMQPYASAQFYNPSATYRVALDVHKALEAARTKIAFWLGARSSEVLFTAGGTEANNLAIHGVMSQYPTANIVVSAIEHSAVLEPARQYDCREAGVRADGRLDLEGLSETIDEATVLVSVMHANNEIGTVQPLREVALLVQAIKKQRVAAGNPLPLYLHTDACQAGNYLDLHVTRLGVDLMTINGGKLYGPKQSGALYVRGSLVLRPLIYGGGQERGLRSGTENVAGAIGLAAAVDVAQQLRLAEVKRLQDLQQIFRSRLAAQLPQATINGSWQHRLPNNIHVTLPGVDNERLLIQLDEAGVMAAAGSACSASDQEASHVLRALGLSKATAQSSLRFSMGRPTTVAMIERTVQLLASFVA
ncbi:MAG: cysteine desulfurase family protein [Candidatus Saccharibacteria bacterium]